MSTRVNSGGLPGSTGTLVCLRVRSRGANAATSPWICACSRVSRAVRSESPCARRLSSSRINWQLRPMIDSRPRLDSLFRAALSAPRLRLISIRASSMEIDAMPLASARVSKGTRPPSPDACGCMRSLDRNCHRAARRWFRGATHGLHRCIHLTVPMNLSRERA